MARERLEAPERIDRPSASDGERKAAEWHVDFGTVADGIHLSEAAIRRLGRRRLWPCEFRLRRRISHL